MSKAIIDSLLDPTTGISKTSLFSTVTKLAGAYEIGEDAGLVPLAKSVEIQMALREGKKTVAFFSILPTPEKTKLRCSGLEGMTLKDVVEFGEDKCAQTLADYLECACSGIMACSTCQVYVSEKWFGKLNEVCPVTEAEMDMIDLAYEPRENSRLGCQIKFSRELIGLEMEIPGASNNMFDPIPFKD